jgi:protein-S-isoprenylcysteine O-methyltransferase Ste14
VGLLVYISAGALRFWSIKILGKEWAIHLVNKFKTEEKPKLIQSGPYKYVRHPIYLGHFLELIGIALAFNAFYSLILVFVVNLPLYMQRANYEEKKSLEKFGSEYVDYKEKTSFMIPLKVFKK